MIASQKDRAFTIINTVLCVIITIATLYPLYFIVIASISEPEYVSTGRVFLLPHGFTLDAYKYVFKNSDVWLGYRNTIFYTFFGTIYNLILTIPTAYVLSKKDLPGHTIMSWFFFITMYFGGGLIPTYLLYKDLHLLNTPWSMIVGTGVSAWNLIVARSFFATSLPDQIFEAAAIDGASEFRSFFTIAIPLSGAIIAIMTLFYAVGHWNSYFNAMIYLNKAEYYPLQLILRRILIQNQDMSAQIETSMTEGEAMASFLRRVYIAESMKYSLVFIASAPMLILYPFIQKFFVQGIMIGSVKG